MTDLFEEVEEQLRSDRYKQFARKVLPWMLGVAAAALVAFLAYWGYDSYQTKQIAGASEKYAAAMDAMVAGDKDKAVQLWGEVAKSNAKGYKSLSLMHLGAAAMASNKTAEAVKLFDEAAEASPDPIIGDVARLKSAFALLDTAPLKDLEGRLKPLMEEGRPFRVQAREALAFAKLNAGDLAGARGDFVLITQSLDAQQGAQARAQAAIGLIDSGSAKAVPAVVKAAKALPPPMMVEPGSVVGPPGAALPPQPQGPAAQ
ncbi:tetratricopeptide repeat protein [Phenylobacterium sp.]|uniref:tetratricopeptide repeat protein n=1 Tax=Phenylobacterium sp. TaxID=1871053 RepID=UPI0025D04DAF|nr:tetratricopeptide repeat protein [Phenylobacterium sp.]